MCRARPFVYVDSGRSSVLHFLLYGIAYLESLCMFYTNLCAYLTSRRVGVFDRKTNQFSLFQ